LPPAKPQSRTILGMDRANFMPAVAAAGILLLVLAGAVMVMYNEQAYTEAKTQQVEAQSRILASTVTAALAFDDRRAAHEYVKALAVDPQILVAAVYDARGALFAGYSRAPGAAVPATLDALHPGIEEHQLAVTVPVAQGATALGTIYLQAAIDPISRRFQRYLVLALLVTMASLIFLLLGIAQRRLTAVNEQLRKQGLDLAEANEKLRAQIEQREKAEAALRQVQKMEAMGQLTGGIAHDFNNLLQVIIGNLEVLQRRNLVANDDGRRMVASAVRGAERASTLTQRLLAFARRQPLDPKPVDVNKLVAGMSELLHRTLGETVRIETVLSGGIWRVTVDANQLENALLNLAVNARDAMDGGGKLTIETANAVLDEAYARTNEIEPGQYVLIAVTDTGAGMSGDVLAKAFEPFFTTKDVGKGSGLGLSQVYGFIRQSDGHAKIYSEPGDGTTIKLYLPRLVTSAEAVDASAEAAMPPPGNSSRAVLVVEDDEDVRAHAVAILSELGYAVLEASDAAAALRVLDARPDIGRLFTDVGLPGGMNGRQLADAARERHPELLVLFTTGYARNAIVHQGRLDPGVELITKPFTFAALANKVNAIFEQHERSRRASAL
jgi:signal transduction histidine kinase/ActR/RegA family two-component response regulator